MILPELAASASGTPVAIQPGLLRITKQKQGDTVLLRLEGALRAAWVSELRDCWRRAREAGEDREIRIELMDVRFVDAAGKALLSEMHRAGVEIIAHGPLTTAIRDEIVSGSAGETAVTS